MHPLLKEAIAAFTPRASMNKALDLDPTSTAILPAELLPNGRWRYVKASARSTLPAQFRRYATPAAEASEATGVPHAFLAQGLATYRITTRAGERRRRAPLMLTPVSLCEDETYLPTGPATINEELAALLQADGVLLADGRVLADPANIIDGVADFAAVITLDPAARKLRRLIEPAIEGKLSPALARLLTESYPSRLESDGFGFEPDDLAALDIDQRAATTAVARGEHIRIFGPPGCGKTQVITAIASLALRKGKRVLICSTVASAVDVARRRLSSKGHAPSSHLALETIQTLANIASQGDVYDLVMIDEATRMTVSEGLVVAALGAQIVVCGDPQQMQPDNGRTSIFDLTTTASLPVYPLHQHYRSRHPHLITFSDAFSYEMRLRTERSPDLSGRDGIDLIVVNKPHIETSAAGKINLTEANLIARRLLQHAEAADPRSVGVIAVTRAQGDAIRRTTANLFAEMSMSMDLLDRHEPFIVRTTDAIQGEERDLICISLTLGPQGGRFDQRFGPLARGDALKRLNVAFSRARSRCEVYTSLLPGMIDRRGRSSQAATALLLALQTFNALLTTDVALEPDLYAAALLHQYRRPGDALDNLGVVTAWRPAGYTRYILGFVCRSERLPRETWDSVVAHLRAIGWTIIVYDQASFDPNDPEITRTINDVRRAATSSA